MASKVPNIIFNNGQSIPAVGLGTWGSAPGEVTQAVKDAIDAGYRHIDGAHLYSNEHEVGAGVNAKIAEGVIKRADIFLTSKLWNTAHRVDLVKPALQTTLKNLSTPYLDLYLMHCPYAFKEGPELIPKDENGDIIYSDVDFVDTWKEMEKLVDEGLTKSIGVSNFNKSQVERILKICRIKPVTNQVECHPYLTQQKLSEYCRSNGIEITSYSPLGSPNREWAKPDDPVLLEEPKIVEIAKKYNKTTAQVLIRYQMDRGHIVIPKSVTKSRIISNFDVLDFKLTYAEIQAISTFECNGRVVPMFGSVKHKYYPFHDEY